MTVEATVNNTFFIAINKKNHPLTGGFFCLKLTLSK
jgi:hypothetical protein